MARVAQNAKFTGSGGAVFRFFVPALCVATVALVISVLCSKLSLGSAPFREWVGREAPAVPVKSSVTLSHLQVAGSWAASALIVNVIFILTTGFCVFVVWQNLSFLPAHRRRTALATLLATAALFSFFTVKGMGNMTAFVQPVKALFPSYAGMKDVPVRYGMDFLALLQTMMSVFAFGTLCIGSREKPAPELIQRRKETASLLLYLGGVTLAIGVIQFDFLFRIIGNSESLKPLPINPEELRRVLTMLAGTSCSLFIAALFTPTLLIIRHDASLLPPEPTENPGAKTERINQPKRFEWDAARIGKFIALLLPLLTGSLSEVISKMVDALFSP